MRFEDYQQIPGMNISTLVHGFKSMRSLKRAIDGGREEPSAAQEFGQKSHTLILEPEEFEKRYVVMPDFKNDPENVGKDGKPSTSSQTNWAKARKKEFATANLSRIIVTREEYDRGLAMVEAVSSHPFASALIRESEKEVVLQGEIDRVPCKGRLDLLGAAISDLKSTADARPTLFGSTAANLHYPVRMAFYRELVKQNREGIHPVYLIAAECAGDFDVCVYHVPEIVLDNFMSKVHALLVHYKAAAKSGLWPGVDEGQPSKELYVPNWAMPDEPLDWGD